MVEWWTREGESCHVLKNIGVNRNIAFVFQIFKLLDWVSRVDPLAKGVSVLVFV
uniref:Uncharacterized protein n=1 Tax=Rhizophora mucronata TaxID=61149 RepID=A0A2P2NNT0_RHIMU